jgi:undecaprenyl-diphosphatase
MKWRFEFPTGTVLAHLRFALILSLSIAASSARAGIDHEWTYDDSGIWNRKYQLALEYGLVGGEVVSALWEGGDTRWGKTMWQSIDSTVAGGTISSVMKYAFSRVRPIDSNNNPNLWFKGNGNESFPSGEVTVVSAVVTPVILEYGHDYPLVYALEALPLYDGIARMKLQAHWQTDVLAGFAIGSASGWWMHRRGDSPLLLSVMPQAVYLGFSKKF